VKQSGFIPVLILLFIATASVVGGVIAYEKYKTTTSTSPELASSVPTESASPLSNSPTPTLVATPSTFPKPTAVATPKSTTKPVSKMVDLGSIDLSVDQKGQIKRMEGPGSFVTASFTDYPNFKATNHAYGTTGDINACFQVRSTSPISSDKIPYALYDNGKEYLRAYLPATTITSDGVAVCQNALQTPGDHTIEFKLNPDKNVRETNFTNNSVSFRYKYEGDGQGPNITIDGPIDYGTSGTCFRPPYVVDNVSTNIKFEHFMDGQSVPSQEHICVKGNKGDSHTYIFRATDEAGNVSEKRFDFKLF
jgi:hypothetical protein